MRRFNSGARGGTALLATVLLLFTSGRARGATDTVVALEYDADAQTGCIGEDELRRSVATHLGRDPFRAAADRRVRISILKTEAGFEGRIVWTDPSGRSFGERRLDSRAPDCREIGANIAFAVAVQVQLIDLREASDSPEGADLGSSPSEMDPATAPPAEAVSLPPPVDVQPPSTPIAVTLAAGAGPALALGLAPQATTLGRVFLSAQVGRVSAELAADGAFSVTQGQPDGSGIVVGADGFSVAGCGRGSTLGICLVGRRGRLRVRGTGVDEPSGSWARFNEVGIRLAMTSTLNHLQFSLHADGLVMLSRWEVLLNDAVVWTTPRIGVLLGVDVALRIF